MPAAEKIRRIETFVHGRYYDNKGILYSHWNFAEERPMRKADFHPDTAGPLGVPMADWYNYENSPMISGIFLAAQCYRYEATRDPQALEMAARAFGSIDASVNATSNSDATASTRASPSMKSSRRSASRARCLTSSPR